MTNVYDVFISYPRKHIAEVEPIKDALEAEGLRVWFDTNDIQDYESITRLIAEGVANSKVLLAYYSAEYPRRRACQWELTIAFLAAQRKGDFGARILVVNPEEITNHIHPIELRDALFRRAPTLGDAKAIEQLAQSVKAHLVSIQDTLGDAHPLIAQQWYGWRGAGSRRFVGRFAEMWKIHSGLHQAEAVSITGTAAPGLAQIYGLGGIGKSLLAEEYALRYGTAYPGGVFWLRAYGHDHTYENSQPEDREIQRDRQLRDFAADLGLNVSSRSTKEVEGVLKSEIERRNQPCLWVVDDVPSDLDTNDIRRWFSPHPLASTLLTTRSRNFESIAYPVALDVLSEADAYQLLTMHRQPNGALEDAAARALLEKLGCHALAVDVTGAVLKKASNYWTFADLYTEINKPSEDVLEFAEELRLDLPNGHEVSIATTLLRSINLLEEAGKDFLRLASIIAASPIPAKFVDGVFSAIDGLSDSEALRRAILATSQAESLSLCERSSNNNRENTWTVHTLVSRTMRFKDSQLQRRELIKQEAVDVLSVALQNARDPIARQTYAGAVPHALEIANEPKNAGEAKLLGLVALYEKELEGVWEIVPGFFSPLDGATIL